MLEIFADGYFSAQAELAKENSPSTSSTAPDEADDDQGSFDDFW
jgi:hypothetical protein